MENQKGFKRILLATDGSRQAEAAVEATIELARLSSARVRVLHIWNLEVHHRHGAWDVEVRSEAEKLLQEAADRVTSAGLMAEKQLYRAGRDHVAAAIALVARDFQADLIVVGSRGLSDWQSMFQRSVSHQVLSALDSPVLVVRARATGDVALTRRILVAVAGGDDVAPAVRATVAAARSRDCSVMVVHVAHAIAGAQGFAYVESDDEVQSVLDEVTRQFSDEGIVAESMVLRSGQVAKTIAGAATSWNADLIVTGSSRMRDVMSMLLGSVSHQLIHSAEVPVLIAERARC